VRGWMARLFRNRASGDPDRQLPGKKTFESILRCVAGRVRGLLATGVDATHSNRTPTKRGLSACVLTKVNRESLEPMVRLRAADVVKKSKATGTTGEA
jgi:hypothetical protein